MCFICRFYMCLVLLHFILTCKIVKRICVCAAAVHVSYIILTWSTVSVYIHFFLLLYCCLCICEEQTNAPKLNVNMRWKRIMCIQRKTEKTNRLKRMRYLYYMYIHVQIVAESKVLWLFQFCRKKNQNCGRLSF